MTVSLYEFQTKDVAKLNNVPNRLIASEMGTGKTFEADALDSLQACDKGDRSLWVGPLGTLRGSRDKMLQFGIDKPLTIIDPKNRNRSWNAFVNGEPGVFFCHYEALRLMPELADQLWAHVIADECHRLQNRKSQQTKAMKRIKKVGARTGLSGTPITGNADKYWSVLNWLYPKQFKSYWKFFEHFCQYHVEYTPTTAYKVIDGPKNVEELNALVEPFYVRHLKKEQCCEDHPLGVMSWLPDKYWDERIVELSSQQRRAYDAMKKDMLAWIGPQEDQPLAAPIAIAQHTRLSQFSTAYAELGTVGNVKLSEPSSKLDACMEIIEDNSTEAIVIWSQFRQVIDLLQARCIKHKIDVVTYTGDNTKVRDSNVQTFAKGGAQIFAGTISAGGVGIDGLQDASSTMIFIDRQFPTTLNIQAEDRLWRDGQDNAVQVIDLVAANTHERGRHLQLAKTWADIKAILGDKNF